LQGVNSQAGAEKHTKFDPPIRNKMKSEEFISNALRTESVPEKLALSKASTLGVLQMLIGAASVADTYKRAIFYGKPLAHEKLKSQLEELQAAVTHLTTGYENALAESQLSEPNLRLLHGSIGIFGESGEMLEALHVQMLTGKLDMVNFAEETGDVDWYKAIVHDETGISEETTRTAVISKLKARYGDKFSSDAATNRNLDAERAVLEEALQGEGK
jgi:hypothetical protein